MELAKRLAGVAGYVPVGSVAADIGTDHAYLPIFLVEEGICPRVIATDLNPGPYHSARQKIEQFRLLHKIDLRLGDGLAVLKPGEANVLVLAGMGGNTIREILSAGPQVLKGVNRLVLQPMADPGDMRVWLVENSWAIVDEKLIEEDGRIYIIVVADPGQEKTQDPLHLELGPRLLESNGPLVKEYLERIMEQYERVLTGLAAAKSEAAGEKAALLKRKLARIREVAVCRQHARKYSP